MPANRHLVTLLAVICLISRPLSAEPASLDVDMSGEVEPLSDGLLILRHLFGFTGTGLVGGALSDDAYRDDPEQIAQQITSLGNTLDVDDDGRMQPLTDGLLILRALFGFSDEALISGALGPSSEATASTISKRITNLSRATTNPTDLVGAYDGSSRTGPFGEESATIIVKLEANELKIEADLFFSSDYQFSGSINPSSTPFSVDGTYVTSDFKNGNWEAKTIVKLSEDALYMRVDDGFRDLRMIGFIPDPDLNGKSYSSSKTYSGLTEGELEQAQGGFVGKMKTYGTCSNPTFAISPTDLRLSITGETVTLTQDAFHEGTCELSGSLAPNDSAEISLEGTFQCSDFSSGSWSSQDIALIDNQVLYATIEFTTEDSNCEYQVKYLGQK